MRDQYRGIVLKTYDQGEADMVVSLFTAEEGKLFLKARGAKKITAKLGPHLQSLSLATISVVAPVRSTLPIVIAAEAIETFPNLRRSSARLAEALTGSAIADVFTEPGEALPAIFEALAVFLTTLERGARTQIYGGLERLSMAVLCAAGFKPRLNRCVQCGQDMAGGFLSPRRGGVLCRACGRNELSALPLSVETLALLRLLADNTRSRRVRFSARQAELVRRGLRRFLEYVAPRPLYAYQFLALLS